MKYALLIVVMICVVTSSSFAATRYTDDNGALKSTGCTTRIVGAGACDAAYAMSQMVASDTLVFLDGSYNVAFGVGGVAAPPSGSSGNPTIIKAENALGAIIRPLSGQTNGGYGVFTLNGQDWITFDGLEIYGPTTAHIEDEGIYSATGSSDNMTFKNGKIHNTNIAIEGPMANFTLQDSTIYDNGCNVCYMGGSSGGGLYVEGDNLLVERNDWYNNTRFHIESNAGPTSNGWIIRRNKFHDGVGTSRASIYMNVSSMKIYSNIFYNEEGAGVRTAGGRCDVLCEIYNNTFVDIDNYAVSLESGVNIVRNNIFYQNASGAINDGAGSNTCSNNLNVTGSICALAQGSTNPFINVTSNDFHLTANDNGGIDLSASLSSNIDYDGITRTNPPDRGAFEFIGLNVTTRYADDNGTTVSGSCTTVQTGAMACTFAYAITQMSPGDTLVLADGTYNSTCIECVPSGSSSSLPTTIRAANARQAIFAPTSAATGSVFRSSGILNWVIDGIVADCGNGPTTCIPFQAYPGTSTNVIVKNGEAKNGKGLLADGISGIWINSQITGMSVHDNGSCPMGETVGRGIFLRDGSNSTVVDGNDIYNSCYWGIELYTDGPIIQNNVIRNNKIHNNKQSIDLGAFASSSSISNTAYNNLIYSNAGLFAIGGSGSTAYHNTIYSNNDYCMTISTTGNNVQLRNNICLNNANGGILDQGVSSACSNNMNVTGCSVLQDSMNPFVNAGSADFHLTADDNGGTFVGVLTDLDNFARGNPPDRGAYDFRGSGVTAGASIFFGRIIR